MVIEGRAERPVYLEIIDDRVELRDARSLWGRGVDDTCRAFWDEYGLPTGVLCIGQAGENLVSMSMAFVDRISTMGRGGFGAVMGSKNLKAVVVKGTGGVRVADRKRYRKSSRGFLENIRTWPHLEEAQEMGLVKAFPLVGKEDYRRMKRRRAACVSCPIGCKDVIEIPDGEFAGLVKCTSSVINLYTPVLYGMADYRQSIKLMASLDDFGLDMFEFFGVMALAKKLADQGIIPQKSVDSEIRLDSLKSMEAWAARVSHRQGLGDVLAGGFKAVIDEFGPEAEEMAPALVKGMQPYAGPGAVVSWDLFGTMELGQVLDPRGPHVGSGGSPTYFAQRPIEVFHKHLKRMGVPREAITRIVKGVGRPEDKQELKVGALLRYSHAWFTTLGSLGICARANINRFYNAEICAEFYETVTGIETDLPALRKRVDRVWTLYRMANLREGYDRQKDEALPEKWFGEKGFRDYLTGRPLTPSDVEGMIEEYNHEWGWDPATGVPSLAELQRLGLVD